MKHTKMVNFYKIVLFLFVAPSFLTSCLPRYSNSFVKMIANNSLKAQDGGFNQAAWNGIKAVVPQAQEELDVLYPDTQDNPSMITSAVTKSVDDGYRALVLPGFTYHKTVMQKTFFDVYNDTYFLAIDVNKYEDIKKQNHSVVNKYYEILVDESKPGFAAGVDVGLQIFHAFRNNPDAMLIPFLKNNDNYIVKITAIGGMAITPIKNYVIGFNKGINWVRKNILEKYNTENEQKLFLEWHPVTFNGGFGTDDSIRSAQTNTKNAIKNNVGVIFGISVPDANTILKELATAKTNTWYVGVDVDQKQDKNLDNYKDYIKTSALKDIMMATKTILEVVKKRIENNDAILDDYPIKPGTNNFIWSKNNPNISLVPMNNKNFEDFWGNLLGKEYQDKIELLKSSLDIEAEQMKNCFTDEVNPVFGNIQEDTC